MKQSFLTIAAILTWSGAASAWVNNTGTCPFGTSNSFWTAGNHTVFLCNGNSWTTLAGPSPAPEKTAAGAQSVVLSAFGSWTKYGSHSAALVLDTSGRTCPSGWFDNGNQVSEFWWHAQPLDACGGTSIGCTTWDHATCVFSGDNQILASDAELNSTVSWPVIDQDTIADCLTLGDVMEDTAIHEIGHMYGLDHENSRVATMQSVKPRVKNCANAGHFDSSNMPDDFQGFMEFHKGYTGSRFNLAGTPWYKSGSTATIDRPRRSVSASNAITVPVTVTIHSYFPHSGPDFAWSFRAVPEAQKPTFVATPTSSFWTWPSPSPSLQPFKVTSLPGWYSSKISTTLQVFGSDLTATGTYRVWVSIDSANSIVERSESDNVFPTDVLITRT